MKTRVVTALVATMLLLSLAYPALAKTDPEDQSHEDTPTTPVKDPYLEEYLPCTNARYRAWYGAS